MAKHIVLNAKYRTTPESNARRIKLILEQKEENPPILSLYNGAETPMAKYESDYSGNNPLEDPRDPHNLRANLKDLSKKLSDSGVFPPGFFEELHQRLENNHWYPPRSSHSEV